MRAAHRAFVGLGSNLEEPTAQVRAGLTALAAIPDCALERSSGLYRSAPLGFTAQPEFVNAVACLRTALAPEGLLAALLAIERAHGRTRAGPKGGPRTLDLDLLLYDALVCDTADLVLPHPRLHERAFVLYPLGELCPRLVVPGRGRVGELSRTCVGQRVERLSVALTEGTNRV